jgi:hypothetical protein
MRIEFRYNNILHAITFGKSKNGKIASSGEIIGQSFHFSREQFENAGKVSMGEFFDMDGAVCLDCPLKGSKGGCYTHKVTQYMGFLSTLKSVRNKCTWDEIPELDAVMIAKIVKHSRGKYFRFGSYGEPSLLPYGLISAICDVAKSWTGYTHQWPSKPELLAFFMASVHTERMENKARSIGWRSFVATPTKIEGFVNCPASAEGGYKSTCSKCGLCSGTQGKGNKSIYILEH